MTETGVANNITYITTIISRYLALSWLQWPENIISNLGSGENRFIRKLPNLRPTSSVYLSVQKCVQLLSTTCYDGAVCWSEYSIGQLLIELYSPALFWPKDSFWTGKIGKEEETINDGTWSGWVSSAMIRCANSGGWAEWMSLLKLRCGGGWQR